MTTVTLVATEDTYINEGVTGTNYGTQPSLIIDDSGGLSVNALVKFDLSSLPSNITITGAYLRAYAEFVAGNPDALIGRVTATWDEGTVTWTSRPGTSSTGVLLSATTTGFVNSGDISSLVQDWVDGTHTNHGIYLSEAMTSSESLFLTSTEGSNPDHYPRLVVTYELNISPQSPATPVSPVGAVVVNRANPIPLEWTPNGDSQSKADVRWRVGAGAWTTVANAVLTQTSYSIAASTFSNGDDVEWQVLTYNSIGDAATDWSASAFFEAGDVPSPPSPDSPTSGATITSSTATMTVIVADLDEIQFRRRVNGGGATIETTVWFADPTKRSHTWTGLADGDVEQWEARIKLDGLESSWLVVDDLTIDYTEPAAPSLTVTAVQDDGRILLQVTNPAPSGGQPAVTHNQIRRRVTGSDWSGNYLKTQSGGDGPMSIASNGAANDRAVQSGEDYEYQVVAFGANGATSESAWTGGTTGDPGDYGGY